MIETNEKRAGKDVTVISKEDHELTTEQWYARRLKAIEIKQFGAAATRTTPVIKGGGK
jgi:hypothetical protein